MTKSPLGAGFCWPFRLLVSYGVLLLAEIGHRAFSRQQAKQAEASHCNGDDCADDGGKAGVVLCDAVDRSRDDIRPEHKADELYHDDSPVLF